MPVVAANLTEAIALTSERIALENRTNGQIYSQLVIFNNAIDAAFDVGNANDRIVRNWMPTARLLEAELLAGAGVLGPEKRQEVVDLVCRVLFATNKANDNSLISAAQNTAVLNAWNNSFGALP